MTTAQIVGLLVLALAEKVSALKTTEFFAERIARARPDRLEKILAKTQDHPPVPGDELPAGWRGLPRSRRSGPRERKTA